jgi:hypothetical protein
VKKDFNQCQQSWWKLFELTTANSLFLKDLPKLLHWLVLQKNYAGKILQKQIVNKIAFVIFCCKTII